MNESGEAALQVGYLPVGWLEQQRLDADNALACEERVFSAWGRRVRLRLPRLSGAQAQSLATFLRTRGASAIRDLPVASIAQAIDRCCARLLDPQEPLRRLLDDALPVITGFDAEMLRIGLNASLRTYRGPQLERFLAADFPDPRVLDRFVPNSTGGWHRACGPALLALVWAGNVPGLPLWSLVSGLLVKAPIIGKLPSAEPLLAGVFARMLAQVEPRLADALAVTWWPGGSTDLESVVLAEAEVVLAYGNNETLDALAHQVPVTARYLAHGHKLSLGAVSRTALDDRSARSIVREAALDVMRWDQSGCYSPQQFFVETGAKVSPREWAEWLGHELSGLQHRFRRRELGIAEKHALAAWRNSGQWETDGATPIGETDASWAVRFEQGSIKVLASPLNRSVQVCAVERLDDVLPLLDECRGLLQTLGLAASPEELFRLAPLFAQAGVTRICAIGAMSVPAPGWHHDGRSSLADLVRRVDLEASAETLAESFSGYRD